VNGGMNAPSSLGDTNFFEVATMVVYLVGLRNSSTLRFTAAFQQ
jgi:hypothetical protein